jgi:small neutral amino acid transporter SnatA (MarC family)
MTSPTERNDEHADEQVEKAASRPARTVLLSAGGLALASVLAFGAIAPPEHCPRPTEESLAQSAGAAVDWFTRNQNSDGTWLYEYDADSGVDLGGYNVVRHAGAIMGLYQAAADGYPGALESADRGMEWVRQNLLEHDDWTALRDGNRVPTGGTALLVAGLVERRLHTGDATEDELLKSLGRFLVAQTNPDGAVIAQFDPVALEPVADSRSRYYTGEAYWALARMHRLFPDDGFGAASDRVGEYLATRRDDVEQLWPPLPDHWSAYGLAETVEFPERDRDQPLTEAELEYARRQAGLFGGQVRWVAQQAAPWGELVRGTHVVRGGGYGVVGEALTGLWRVAEADERLAAIRAPLAERAECIAGLAQDVQHRDDSDPRADGAWLVHGVTRMDDQQHAISALLRTKAIVQTEASESTSHDPPSGWLWAIALLATFNPLLVRLALPRRATARERATLAVAGGAIGSTVVVTVAALSGPLLDLLDVSRPSARIAVGVVGAVAGIVRMLRKLPGAQPAPQGLQAAVVPVAIPYVATPALILLGLSAGADLGVLFVALVLLLAVAALAGLAAVESRGLQTPVLEWAGRLLAVVAVATSVLLVVNGVLDV